METEEIALLLVTISTTAIAPTATILLTTPILMAPELTNALMVEGVIHITMPTLPKQ
jgi:hypothetical protein